jgi:ketosteroid isomerase-like protein
MPAHTPEDVHPTFAKLFSAGDLEGVMALYEPGARLIPQPGASPVSGPAIRQVLQGFLALQPSISIQTTGVVKTQDVALLQSQWTLSGKGADGQPVEMSHRSVEVVRRQPDGTWRFLIDDPFGGE